MIRKGIIFSAFLLGTGLFLMASSSAQGQPPPFGPPFPGPRFGPRPLFRPPLFGPRPLLSIVVPPPYVRIGPPPPVVEVQVGNPYRVVYRAGIDQPWQTQATYRSRAYALDAADQLRSQGYEVNVWQQ